MTMEKHGDPTPGTVLRTPSINRTVFVSALVAKGCSQATAEGVAAQVLQQAGRPPTWPVTKEINHRRDAPHSDGRPEG